jgi:3,4-dihydroxy 2-butanone 4-phosphate synthase / GTP cyclohydrolase II
MKLSDWLVREGITKSDFAASIGVSPPTISDLCWGNQWLSRKTAKKIELATGGEVTAADFVHLAPDGGTAPDPLIAPDESSEAAA